jgi:phosphohistidine phosphatase SixA
MRSGRVGGGHAQAVGLVDRFRDWPVTRILSSPTIRCLQTVTPLAADRGLQVETVDALAVDGDARHVLRMLTGPGLRRPCCAPMVK